MPDIMTDDKKIVVRKCPECGAVVKWEGNRYRPFCSSRCKQVDLGKWLREEYSLPVHDVADFLEDNPGQKAIH